MDLIDALKLIREVCTAQERCLVCPMRSCSNGCVLQNIPPDEWVFECESGKAKRLFE